MPVYTAYRANTSLLLSLLIIYTKAFVKNIGIQTPCKLGSSVLLIYCANTHCQLQTGFLLHLQDRENLSRTKLDQASGNNPSSVWPERAWSVYPEGSILESTKHLWAKSINVFVFWLEKKIYLKIIIHK